MGNTKAFIFGKSISLDGHKHDEYASNGKVDGITGVVKTYDSITIPSKTATNRCIASTTIDLTDIGFDIYKALVTIMDNPNFYVSVVNGTSPYNFRLPAFGAEIELITNNSIISSLYNGYSHLSISGYRSVSLLNNVITLSTYVVLSDTSSGSMTFVIPQHNWSNVTFKLFA